MYVYVDSDCLMNYFFQRMDLHLTELKSLK